jgi:hypothetical protein
MLGQNLVQGFRVIPGQAGMANPESMFDKKQSFERIEPEL